MSPPSLVDLAILALAVWRVSYLLAEDDGPFDIMVRFRGWIGEYFDEHSRRQHRNQLARLISCIYCNSIWIGGLVAAVYGYVYHLSMIDILALALALSGAATAIYRLGD